MKERKFNRHLSTFLFLIIGPIVIMILFITLVMNYQKRIVQKQYHLQESDMTSSHVLFDKALLLNSYTKEDYEQLISYAETRPELLLDYSIQKGMDASLNGKFSFLFIEYQGEFMYLGDPRYKTMLETRLKQIAPNANNEDAVYIRDEDLSIMYKTVSFEVNHVSGHAFIVTQMNERLPHIKFLTYAMLISVIILFVVMSIAIINYVYIRTVRPIRELQEAVNQIGEGNLDVEIRANRKNEFTKLYNDLDQMRVRLKDSVLEQQRTDTLTREVIGNISHDLKTPLTAIKGYAEGILDGVATTPERLEKYVKTIYAKASDMAGLVDELAFFTKINQNDVMYNFTTVIANRYFGDAVSELTLDLELKDINLIFQTNLDDSVLIYIDVEKIKRVINNIIGNAAKYIQHEKGIILVKLIDEDEQILVRMEDNGVGIDEEELPHIFDRFYRTDSSRRSTTGGSGLGLAITKKIVEDHGGEIWAESKIGEGTAILFKLDKCKGIQTKEDMENE